ncbi:hypothetical protein [Streptomyces sp. NPDC056061]|uniref:hypothetical protein n=1 Tax=Streptomyces sp. NPDC056061 TaxID=3345700 RepID=UPI0035DAE858
MRTRTVRRVGLAAALATALISVTSCSGAATADLVAALRKIEKKTDGVSSAKVEGTIEMGDLMSMKQTGVVGWADGLSGSMKITYTGGSMADVVKQNGGSGTMEARYYADGYAVNMGDAFAQQSGGKHWISYRYADMAKLAGASGEVMKQQMQSAAPNQGVRSLLASGDIKKVGEEDVRGVSTTHYSGTLDVAELTGKDSGLDDKQLAELKQQLSEAGISTEQVDIWVDKNDLLIKKTERARMKTGEMNVTMYYSDYGTKVSVEKPPAGDTATFADVMKQLEKSVARAG